jgi:LPXTG-site transpeptidase (sortase) family protein
MIRVIGLFLIIIASLGLFNIYYPLIRAYLALPNSLLVHQQRETNDLNYRLVIPKLGVDEPVVFGVDAGNEAIYSQALQVGVAQAAGTALPGNRGLGYYFGHSSADIADNQKVVFAGLDLLHPEDIIEIYYDNTLHRYAVAQKMIVEATDISWLQPQGGQEYIVLQTCWPIGTNLRRLLVIARPIDQDVSGVDRGGAFGKISLAMKRMN